MRWAIKSVHVLRCRLFVRRWIVRKRAVMDCKKMKMVVMFVNVKNVFRWMIALKSVRMDFKRMIKDARFANANVSILDCGVFIDCREVITLAKKS